MHDGGNAKKHNETPPCSQDPPCTSHRKNFTIHINYVVEFCFVYPWTESLYIRLQIQEQS
jgi:hypothetical protein